MDGFKETYPSGIIVKTEPEGPTFQPAVPQADGADKPAPFDAGASGPCAPVDADASYRAGYEKGYGDGFSIGKREGYEEGETAGFAKGKGW
jgi:hypothetical protein